MTDPGASAFYHFPEQSRGRVCQCREQRDGVQTDRADQQLSLLTTQTGDAQTHKQQPTTQLQAVKTVDQAFIAKLGISKISYTYAVQSMHLTLPMFCFIYHFGESL